MPLSSSPLTILPYPAIIAGVDWALCRTLVVFYSQSYAIHHTRARDESLPELARMNHVVRCGQSHEMLHRYEEIAEITRRLRQN